MSFNTAATIKLKLQKLLKFSNAGDLPDNADEIVADALEEAYNEILTAFITRGYSKADIDQWDRGVSIERDQALYWCMIKMAGQHGGDSTYIQKLDRRPDLWGDVQTGKDPMPLIANNQEITPTGRNRITSGDMNDDLGSFKRRVTGSGEVDQTSW